MIKVFIDGKSGTTGLRIYERLESRTDIELITLSEEQRKEPLARKTALNSCDIAFLCLPDAAAIEAISFIENPNVVVLDTSTAHRTNPEWAYGFPELSVAHFEKIKNSKRIAVPGCHASGFISLVYPLVAEGIISEDVLLCCNSITGYSGGGKSMIAEYQASDRCTLLDAPRQYGITQKHKHLPEMASICGLKNAPAFSPIVADFYSGMEVTVPIFKQYLRSGASVEDIINVYRNLYKGPVVTYSDKNENGFLSAVAFGGKDSMNISVYGNEDRILLTSRYDNLGKGASGAALECMNIVLGIDPTIGLEL